MEQVGEGQHRESQPRAVRLGCRDRSRPHRRVPSPHVSPLDARAPWGRGVHRIAAAIAATLASRGPRAAQNFPGWTVDCGHSERILQPRIPAHANRLVEWRRAAAAKRRRSRLLLVQLSACGGAGAAPAAAGRCRAAPRGREPALQGPLGRAILRRAARLRRLPTPARSGTPVVPPLPARALTDRQRIRRRADCLQRADAGSDRRRSGRPPRPEALVHLARVPGGRTRGHADEVPFNLRPWVGASLL